MRNFYPCYFVLVSSFIILLLFLQLFRGRYWLRKTTRRWWRRKPLNFRDSNSCRGPRPCKGVRTIALLIICLPVNPVFSLSSAEKTLTPAVIQRQGEADSGFRGTLGIYPSSTSNLQQSTHSNLGIFTAFSFL